MNRSLRKGAVEKYRIDLLKEACGKILEIGYGTGLNAMAIKEIINPFYNILACGCNVDRDFETIISANGFTVIKCAKSKIWGRPIAGYIYSGLAKKRE